MIGIIPARFESTRLPGKPLADIDGKPMIVWVAERAQRSRHLDSVIVATDDERIRNCVQKSGFESVMTPSTLASGTDRVAYAARDLNVDIIVNIQGDEPFIQPEAIDRCIDLLLADDNEVMATLIKPISDPEWYRNPDVVKVAVSRDHHALYFSRSPIPSLREEAPEIILAKEKLVYEHIGVYGYRKSFLMQYASWSPTPLEKSEALEQLRALEHGIRIKVAETSFESLSVDTEEDLERARRRAIS